jgi:hypothetical protein
MDRLRGKVCLGLVAGLKKGLLVRTTWERVSHGL